MELAGKLAAISPEELNLNGESALNRAPRLWVLVADRRKARIFFKAGGALECLGEAMSTGSGREDLSNKSIGNIAASSGGSLHHQYAPHMGASRHDELLFVNELSAWLDEACKKDCFDRLVLVAPPQMLGYLRQGLHKRVLDRVTAEVKKDLMRLGERAIQRELSRLIVF